MKKFFTLIAAVMMTAGAFAQNVVEWNFTNWDAATFSETTTKDGLTLYATSDANITIDGNKKTFDEVLYEKRLKLGGTGNVKDLTAPVRALAFEVTGPCSIYIAAMSSSSSESRYLDVAKNDNGSAAVISETLVSGTEQNSFTCNYTDEGSNTIYIYSLKSGINIYDIKVTYTTTGISSVKTAETVADGATYNLAGQKVSADYKGVVIKNGKKFINK